MFKGKNSQNSNKEITILMPCLNEAETLEKCISKAQTFLKENYLSGEVLIADNGSNDGSPEIAHRMGARVVSILDKGYGAALMGGIRAAAGKYVIMGDADDSYDFLSLMPFVQNLRDGYDLVMGNRFIGEIKPGAMPPLHQYFGNPLLSGIGRIFFHTPIRDFHCGLRGFKKDSIESLKLQMTGMEFASEMVIKAHLNEFRITEVPTILSPDGRSRRSHLRSWRDGWRHLRFMLLYSPRWLFLIPGITLVLIGIVCGLALVSSPQRLFGVVFDVHTLLYCAFAILIGFQSILFAIFTKVYGKNNNLLPPDPGLDKLFRLFRLERGILIGVILLILGLTGSIGAFMRWEVLGFGQLNPRDMLRSIIPAGLALVLGSQIILASFFLSVLNLEKRKP